MHSVGTNLPTTVSDAQVLVDGVDCVVGTVSATQLTCTTGPRPSNSTLGFTLASLSRGMAETKVLIHLSSPERGAIVGRNMSGTVLYPRFVLTVLWYLTKSVLQGDEFVYKDRWSDRVTWAGEPPPFEGESVVIPAGQHILYDLKSSPKLALILVEGTN